MTTPGKLLVIDGPDGAGKTTALDFIKEAMLDQGRAFKCVNILSTHKESFRMRQIVTDPKSDLSPRADLLLYAAAITNCFDLEITPTLQQGIDVVVDRGPLSNFAYQLQDLEHELFPLWLEIHKRFQADSTLILTTDLEKGLQRCKARDSVLDRQESRPLSFHQKMLHSYISVMNNPGLFGKLTGTVKTYHNDSTLEQLRENCTNFVQGVFTADNLAESIQS